MAVEHREFAGFWLGLWQGLIALFVFVASLFKGNLNVYEVHNNGSWYNFGYLFGLAFGGAGNRASRRCGKSNFGAGAKWTTKSLNPKVSRDGLIEIIFRIVGKPEVD